MSPRPTSAMRSGAISPSMPSADVVAMRTPTAPTTVKLQWRTNAGEEQRDRPKHADRGKSWHSLRDEQDECNAGHNKTDPVRAQVAYARRRVTSSHSPPPIPHARPTGSRKTRADAG